jgi:predicted metal-dependent hydrolase
MNNKVSLLASWPPSYTLKKHARVKNVKLKASARNGLELVVPPNFNKKNIPKILEGNREWIQKQLAKIHAEVSLIPEQSLPDKIELLALNRLWNIIYIQSDNKKLRLISRPNQELVIFGDIQNITSCFKLLKLWVKKQAHLYLPTCLQEISQTIKLPYKSLVIRGQTSRWGSCSAEKAINLNYKLLFLPSHLVTHILVHELCHTIHLNHSPAFWRLVASFDAQWQQYSYETRRAQKWIPRWIEM